MFGALLLPKVGWPLLRHRAVLAEELGLVAVYVDDHLVNPADPRGPWLDAWATLAGLAQVTSRVRLGPLVANIVLRHPVVLARHALTLDELSGGRLDLGLGAGYAPSDHRPVGQPIWPAAERSARFHAAALLVDRLLRGEAVDDLTLAPPSSQRPRPPITIAAHAPASLRLAARLADTWVSYGGFGLSPARHLALTARRIRLLREACEAVGRNPAGIRRRLLAGSAAVTAEPIWSSAGAFADFVGRYRQAGIDEFVFYFPPESAHPPGTVDPAVAQRILADAAGRT